MGAEVYGPGMATRRPRVSEPVLSPRELNRAALARQLLLARAALSLPRALERMGGLQAQYAPSMYVGLWSRLRDLRREALTASLHRRAVVQGTLLRSTIHLVSARDYWPFALAVRDRRRAWWRSVNPGVTPGADEAALAEAASRLADFLEHAGQASTAELEEVVGRTHAAGVGLWLELVRVPPSGTWERRRADLFGLAERWVGEPTVGVEEATEHVVRRYLGAFGPAHRSDIASWAGVTVGQIAEALGRLEAAGPPLRRFRDVEGRLLVDLPRAPLPDPATPAPVRFLPTWDALLLVHARRTAVLPEEYRPSIFTSSNPQSVGTVLVDGRVVATWRFADGRVRVSPFEALPAQAAAEVAAEAERLTAFHVYGVTAGDSTDGDSADGDSADGDSTVRRGPSAQPAAARARRG